MIEDAAVFFPQGVFAIFFRYHFILILNILVYLTVIFIAGKQ
jgi:hypothetical protein